MNGRGHYALGLSAGLVLSQAAGLSPWQTVVVVPVSAAFAHGAVSPDIDNTPRWRSWDRWTPDELLGEQGPMRHRGITHWWGVHLALTAALYVFHPLLPSWLPWWVLGAVLAAWWSHLLGDLAIGARGYGRGPGIPLAPWWAHWGPGFCCGGIVEAVLTVAAPVGAVWWAGWLTHLPDTHEILAGLGL